MASRISNTQRSWTETPPASPIARNLVGELISTQKWLDGVADPLQQLVQSFYGKPGSTMRQVKSVISGTWLGHALHPVLTDIPIGGWSCTLLLDLMWLNKENKDIARASDATLLLGLVGATGSITTGLTDWSDTDGTDRRVGILHGLLNIGISLTNLTSYLFRLGGQRRTGIALSTVGYMLSMFTANLGGELSYSKGIGVNHVAWEGGSDDFVAVMNEQDLQENTLTRVDAAGIPVVLLKQRNTIYAIAATCSHLAGPLDEGTVVNGENGPIVECPWHGSRFCMRDGSVVNSPAVYAQPTFAVRVQKGKIQLRRQVHA